MAEEFFCPLNMSNLYNVGGEGSFDDFSDNFVKEP